MRRVLGPSDVAVTTAAGADVGVGGGGWLCDDVVWHCGGGGDVL